MNRDKLLQKIWTLAEKVLPFTFYRYLIFLRNKREWKGGERSYREEYFYKFCPFSKEKYYIIRLEYPVYAHFAAAQNYIFVAEYARHKGIQPIIALQIKKELKEKNLSGENEWEIVFSQPKIKDILQRNATILVSEVDPCWRLYLSETCLDVNKKPDDRRVHAKENDWKNYYGNVHRYVKKYWKFNKDIMNETKKKYAELFQHGNCVLGVALREAFSEEFNMQIKNSEAVKVYRRHPLGPNVDEILDIVDEYLEKWSCDKIFIASEFSDSIKKFEARFLNKIIYCERVRGTMSEVIAGVNSRKKFINNSWGNDQEYKDNMRCTAKEYTQETVLLSKCAYLIGAKSGQTIAALAMNGGRYKDIKVLEDKNHIERY